MKRVAIIALNSFFFWERCISTLKPFADGFIIRLDTDDEGSPSPEEVQEFFCKSLIKTIYGGHPKDGFTWREEMLRELDHVKPETVFAFDNDESITYDFKKDLENFESSDKRMMMLLPKMITKDNRKVPQYPSKAHCKVFKWQKGMSYKPYSGYAYVNPYSWSVSIVYYTDYLYSHWCFYTKKMEAEKTKHAIKKYGSL